MFVVRQDRRDVRRARGPASRPRPRTVTARLIEGEFPNYEQLIPSGYPNRLTVVARDARGSGAADADRRRGPRGHAGAPGDERRRPRALGDARRSAADATEAIDAKFEGTDVTVAFNPQFLLDGLLAVEGDEVVLETLDPLKPATLKGTDHPEFLYLLMPVRIS